MTSPRAATRREARDLHASLQAPPIPFLYATHHFPPLRGISTQRVLGLVKYLPRLGFRPLLVVPASYWEPFQEPLSCDESTQRMAKRSQPKFQASEQIFQEERRRLPLVSRIPFLEARKIFTIQGGTGIQEKISFPQKLHRTLLFPDSKVFFSLCALPYCWHLIQQYHPPLLLTHSPPHSTHLLGIILKKLYPSLRWIADFEDAYSASPHAHAEGHFRHSLHSRLERCILDCCDHILYATPQLKQISRSLSKTPSSTLYNAYDDDLFRVSPTPLPHPSLVHAGSFFAYRTPVPFLKLLAAYFQQNPESHWHIYFIGRVEQKKIPTLRGELAKHVSFLGHRPRRQALSFLHSATALLVIHGSRSEARLHLPAKIFEYLAVRKPVLAFTHPGPLANFVDQEKLGSVISPDDPCALEQLTSFLQKVEQKEFQLPPHERICQFSREERAKELAVLFRKLIRPPQ